MGSLFKPKPAQTPVPQQATFETQIDQIGKTKTERVIQPDGTPAIVTTRLPQTAEEKEYEDKLLAVQTAALKEIDRLSNTYDLTDQPEIAQLIEDYRTTNNLAVDNAARDVQVGTERNLARFGVEDSTAGTEFRLGQAAGVRSEKEQIERDISGIRQQARDAQLSKQYGLYNTSTSALNGQQATQLGSLQTNLNAGLAGQNARQAYNNTVAATIGANNAAKVASSQAGLSNLIAIGSIAAAPFTGGASLAGLGLAQSAKSGGTGGWASYGAGPSNQINWASGRNYGG